MVILVLVTGGIWAFDAMVLARRRRAAVATHAGAESPARREAPPEPKVVEYAKSFFPVFLVVFLLRSFLVEPFRIPSGSMMPTLLIGDFILVNKFSYGIRLPVVDRKMVELGDPERGDVVVFRYPEDPSTPFIKRIVGLPGDVVEYRDKTVYINGEVADQVRAGTYTGTGSGVTMNGASFRREALGGSEHSILVMEGMPGLSGRAVVPEGHYFVLGDNRDNSRDSRYWGTVPDRNLIGKAFTIWMNWDGRHGPDWSRIGRSIE
jgi:signal peptidase I